jgi:hypothetical protein
MSAERTLTVTAAIVWFGPFVSFDTKGRQSQMLRHAHFYMKGGKRTFAALCMEVCYADKPDLRSEG